MKILVYELHKRLLDDIELSNVTCDCMHESNVQIFLSICLPFFILILWSLIEPQCSLCDSEDPGSDPQTLSRQV